jgi:HK97 family phage major capsid protein
MYKRADDNSKTGAKVAGQMPVSTPSKLTGADDQTPPVSENSAMTYAGIIEQMGALYAAMQSMVEQANSEGAMTPAAEKELAGMRSRYDSLVLLRDSNISVMERGAKSASFSVPAILTNISRPAPTQSKEARYADAFGAYLLRSNRLTDLEQRDLSEGTAADGGYLPSTDFYNQLQKKM